MSNELQINLERQLLAELLADPKAFYQTSPMLGSIGQDAWTCPHRGAIYAAMQKATTDGHAPDMVAVSIALSEMGLLESVGGLKAIGDAAGHAISSAYAEQHAQQLIDTYMVRQIDQIGTRIRQAVENGSPAGEIGTDAVRELQAVLECRGNIRVTHVKESVSDAMSTYAEARASEGKPSGIQSGLIDLDEQTGGWQSEDFIILAARPSTGKTNVALSWIVAAARECPVLFFSAEMSSLTITQRMIGAGANLNDRRIKRAMLAPGEVARMINAGNHLADANIYLSDIASPSIDDIEITVRQMVREKKIALVVLDYIGKVRTERKRSRQEEVADVSARLKAIAMEHRIPVIALAQLNRNIESRAGLPMLSDLRESGDLEQDADVVIFLHSFARAGLPTVPDGFGKYSGLPSDGFLCFVIAKQRKGPVGEVLARFTKETGRIIPVDGLPTDELKIQEHHEKESMPF